MAAKSSTLGTLHELFAQYWLDQMNREVEVYDNEGEVVGYKKQPLSAAEAAVLRAFLKDNNVRLTRLTTATSSPCPSRSRLLLRAQCRSRNSMPSSTTSRTRCPD